MLDTDTKRRIDIARDILVGKVPDPKSQVEQITIALIYKFMDDMDAESEELGGKRKFFTSDFMVEIVDPKKDDKILDPACGTAGLLVSAYKYIKLQNSSASQRQQAEALKAQKTPEDRIHTSSLNGASGDLLTPDDRAALARNIQGYDISPDMVRLSLVNLYLHGFNDPHIYEYDTLTSEERWNEFADVILANPPFMSPKGGIKPHQRFSIQSKRSEVLFVDYMADHLTPGGRAAIIVPEGIIFQSQNAYKDLRRKLIDECLVAVVSLPAGCFNPYSGVKTSILIFDKSLAKHSPTLGFFKVENDGFGLGAQRRPIDKNDLPQVKRELQAYLQGLRAGEATEELELRHGLVVEKARITEGGECNLSGERYREATSAASHFPFVSIKEVCTVNPKKSELSDLDPNIDVAFVPMSDINENRINFEVKETKVLAEVGASYTYFAENDVLLAKVTPCFENGKAGIARGLPNRIGFGSSEFYVLRNSDKVLPEWLYYCVTSPLFREPGKANMTGTGGLQRVPRKFVEDYEIPLPPLPVQKEIVAEIEAYQKVIDGARAVLDHYRPHIPIHPDWPMVELKKCSSVQSGYGFPKDEQGLLDEEIPFLKVSDMNSEGNEVWIRSWNNSVSWETLKNLKAKAYPEGTVIFPKIGAAIATNKKRILTRPSAYDNNVMGIIADEGLLDSAFLHTWLLSFDLSNWASSSSPPSMRKSVVEEEKIPLPPLETQQAIVAEIEAEQSLVQANHELIERMEKKIEATLARVWGEAPEAVVPEIAGDSGELLAAEEPAVFNSK